MKIKLTALDPALSNLGIAMMTYDTEDESLELNLLVLVQTEGTKVKQVRKNSDDLERAIRLRDGMMDTCKYASLAIAEIPMGTQSSRGAMSNGIVIGVLASCPCPLIQVSPTEVKMASVGIKTATKGEMIEWAVDKYPKGQWLYRKSKGKQVLMNDNEHLADAVAIAYAGIRTDQFKQAMGIFRSAANIRL